MRPAAFLARTSSTVLVAWLSLASPLAAQTGTVTKVSNAAIVDVSRVRIDNFGQVDSAYYRGAQPAGQDYADLAALGIRTVIDLQADADNSAEAGLVEQAGMKFLRIPMTTHVAPTAEQLALFLQIVNDPTQQPVYVHCAGGRHRTGVMTAVYRMENHGWTADQAFKEMKRYKFGLDVLHSEFKNFVYGYQPVAAKGPVLAVATPKIQF